MSSSETEQGAVTGSADAATVEATSRSAAPAVVPEAPPARPAGTRSRRARPARSSARPASLPPENELWDVHAAARFLKRSASWVYHRAEDGTLPVRRLGGWGIRFIPAELRAWVESGAGDSRRR